MRGRSLLRRARRPLDRRRDDAAVARLRADDDPRVRAVGAAVTAALHQAPSTDERTWLERIERRREQLEASGDELVAYAGEWTGDPTDRRESRRVLGDVARNDSKGTESARILFHLIRALRPASAVELGTCVGMSTAYQASALRLNGEGRLATFEAVRARSDVARAGAAALGLDDVAEFHVGRFQDVLPGALKTLAPVDYAFIDGHHEERATVEYFHLLLEHLAPHSTLVFDDINWSEGMVRAWAEVSAHPRVLLAADLVDLGVLLLEPAGAAEAAPRSIRIRDR